MWRPKETPTWGVVAGVFLFWLAGAFFLPVIQDEAYYATWSHYLDWGYFDHPPAVAWLAQLNRVFPSSALALRAGTLVVALLTLLTAVRLFVELGFDKKRLVPVAMLLLYGNILGLVFGFLATPDTGLMLAWGLALHEAAVALKRDPRRWMTAGIVTGLGILSKYTMTMIGPVFLVALLVEARDKIAQRPRSKSYGLATPWPYLGGVLAILVCLPHLIWNAQQDWITVRFQTRHGLALAHSQMLPETMLPVPAVAKEGSPEFALAKPFLDLEMTEKKLAKPASILGDIASAIERYVGFYLSQIALWGGCLVAIVSAWRAQRRSSAKNLFLSCEGLESRSLQALIISSAAIPLIVCGLLSITSKVEANWSAMYVFGAAAWMAPWVALKSPSLAWGALTNMAIASLLVLHAKFGFLPLRPGQDRVLSETHGYPQLPSKVRSYLGGKPLFAETYQMASMLRFFAPDMSVTQWPGLTRDSEFVRNPDLSPWSREALRAVGGFWLLTSQVLPPRLSPYSGVEMIHLRDCKASDIQVVTAAGLLGSTDALCRSPVHKWYLVRYELGA